MLFFILGGGEFVNLFILLYIVFINYIFGFIIEKAKNKKLFLVLSIFLNLVPLFYFKYFYTLLNDIIKLFNIFDIKLNFKISQIILPLGISFFTFQALSYIIDLYRKEINLQKNPFKLALYIMFFPQLIAGPIIKYKEIEKEINNRKVNINDFCYGIKRFVFGLSKKVLIANQLGYVVSQILSNDIPLKDLSTPLIWLAVVLYTMQIYYDFSGYSDMAIGLGRMFGFHFSENFNYPYISKSIKEFWRRWHISLSTWFKEYIYIPLGGNRKGQKRTLINLGIVFLLTGIWHGASLNFWIWGVWHGIFILFERIFFGKKLQNSKCLLLNNIYVLFVVIIGWALFYCNSFKEALLLLKGMLIWNSNSLYTISYFMNIKIWLIFFIAIILAGPIQKIIPKIQIRTYDEQNVYKADILLISILMILCIFSLVSGTYNPFIYFRF